jgi:hypothetical protein
LTHQTAAHDGYAAVALPPQQFAPTMPHQHAPSAFQGGGRAPAGVAADAAGHRATAAPAMAGHVGAGHVGAAQQQQHQQQTQASADLDRLKRLFHASRR